jgi:hypothetical protein
MAQKEDYNEKNIAGAFGGFDRGGSVSAEVFTGGFAGP